MSPADAFSQPLATAMTDRLPELPQAPVSLDVLQDEVEVAREIQFRILPPTMPEVQGYEPWGLLRPTAHTGGDMFDLVDLEQGVFVLLGDATGHGYGPALSATQMQAMFRVAFRLGADLDQAYVHVNNQMVEDLPDDRFVTAFLGFLDPQAHCLRYHSAGQAPILHWRAGENVCDWHGPTTFPLGSLAVERAEPDMSLAMGPGDVVALLSDGVYEYPDGGDRVYGRERVGALVAAGADRSLAELASQLLASLADFGEGAVQKDDITMVMIRRTV